MLQMCPTALTSGTFAWVPTGYPRDRPSLRLEEQLEQEAYSAQRRGRGEERPAVSCAEPNTHNPGSVGSWIGPNRGRDPVRRSRVHRYKLGCNHTIALPFCHATLTGRRPLDPAYPQEVRSIGDHIRARRFDLGLHQREVATQMGVCAETIRNWELGWRQPAIRSLPAIVQFLGYSPLPQGKSLGEQIMAYRKLRGRYCQLVAAGGAFGRWEIEIAQAAVAALHSLKERSRNSR